MVADDRDPCAAKVPLKEHFCHDVMCLTLPDDSTESEQAAGEKLGEAT